MIAHNLARWTTRLGLREALLTTKTVRTRFLALPGRLARTGRRLHLHLPANWPWQEAFLVARESLASTRVGEVARCGYAGTAATEGMQRGRSRAASNCPFQGQQAGRRSCADEHAAPAARAWPRDVSAGLAW